MFEASSGSKRYDPHNNRGRPKETDDSKNKRIQQMRNAQRTLRARKQEYLLQLEIKNKELLEENTSLKLELQMSNMNSIFDCVNPRCVEKVSKLQAQIDRLSASFIGTPTSLTSVNKFSPQVAQNAQESNISVFSNPTGLQTTNMFDDLFSEILEPVENDPSMFDRIWNFGSATHVATGLPDLSPGFIKTAEETFGPLVIEPFKTEVKALSSIGDSKIVDRLFDVNVACVLLL
ncbi:hypothetical protein HK100_012886 [Physocladia obscura]|uniref:BZIP domain-containing protein n=1 Tax=Physocladia obscura TaxID=109957 RepID=A0AAD5XC61_9FUNG|nr:hypothetical protein HK100_012886 [Physocladia obscura]